MDTSDIYCRFDSIDDGSRPLALPSEVWNTPPADGTEPHPDVGHPLLGRVSNDFGIRLEQVNGKQTVVVGRLVFAGDAQPAMIRIEHA